MKMNNSCLIDNNIKLDNIKVGDAVYFQYQVSKYSRKIGFYSCIRTSRKKYVVEIKENLTTKEHSITLCSNPDLKGRKQCYRLGSLHNLWKA